MLPTIDIGTIVAVGAIFKFLAKVWGFIVKAKKYILDAAWAIVIGNKFWATAFFITAVLFFVSLLSTVFSLVMGQIGKFVLTSSFPSLVEDPSVKLICSFFPIKQLTHLISFAITLQVAKFTCESSGLVASRFYHVYSAAMRAWKT